MFPALFFVTIGAFMTYRAKRQGAPWFQRAGLSYAAFGLSFAYFDIINHNVWMAIIAGLLLVLSLAFLGIALRHKELQLLGQKLL